MYREIDYLIAGDWLSPIFTLFILCGYFLISISQCKNTWKTQTIWLKLSDRVTYIAKIKILKNRKVIRKPKNIRFLAICGQTKKNKKKKKTPEITLTKFSHQFYVINVLWFNTCTSICSVFVGFKNFLWHFNDVCWKIDLYTFILKCNVISQFWFLKLLSSNNWSSTHFSFWKLLTRYESIIVIQRTRIAWHKRPMPDVITSSSKVLKCTFVCTKDENILENSFRCTLSWHIWHKRHFWRFNVTVCTREENFFKKHFYCPASKKAL